MAAESLHVPRAVARGLCQILARVDVDGLEQIPEQGPVLLAVNHRSLIDGPLLFGLVNRPVGFLVKTEAYVLGLSALLRETGQIRVDRATVDLPAVREVVRRLREGSVIGVFPEGSRGDGAVDTVKPGVGYFALRTGACVVPVACEGTPAVVRRRSLGRPRVIVRVGKPLRFDRYPDDRPLPRRLFLAAAEQVRAELATLCADTAKAGTT